MLRKRPVRALVAALAASTAFLGLSAVPADAAPRAVPTRAAPPQVAAAPVGTAVLNPKDGLDGAFGGHPATLLRNTLCPVGKVAGSALGPLPVVGPVASQLPGILCAINVVGFVYRTTYIPPSGPPVVRYTRALPEVPTPIDVDGKGLPDFTGLLGVTLVPAGLSLQVARNPWFPAGSKVSIEAVAINPVAADSYIGFGPDATDSGFGGAWHASLGVVALASDGADLGLHISEYNPQPSMGLVAEMFSGPDPDAPDTAYQGNLGFTPVPADFDTRLSIAEARQQVTVTGGPTKLSGKLTVLTPGRVRKVEVVADQIPSQVTVVHTSTPTADTTTYDANGSIARLTGSYRDIVGGTIKTAAALDAWGVPGHVGFEQAGQTTTVATAPDAAIDRIQARFAQGSDVDPLVTDPAPFARYHRTSNTAFTAGLQVSDLRSVSINQSAPYGGELVFAHAPGLFPFTADDDTTSTHLEGSLSNLPADTTVSIDLDNGVVTFDGHGTGIDQIKLKATRPTPFFQRATRLEATLDGLPAAETVNIEQSDGAVSATATQPLGNLTLLASDGSDAPVIAGSAASYDDTPGLYRAFLRIAGLQAVSFQADPVVASLRTAQSQFLTVRGSKDGLTFDGTVDQLPAFLTFSLKPGPGGADVVDFDSHGEVINEIRATGSGLPAPDGMPNFEALVKHLPSHLTLTLPKSDGDVTFDAHGDHIGRVYAQAFGGTKRTVDPDRQLLAYSEGQYVAANLLQIGNAAISQSAKPLRLSYDIGSAPLDYAVTVPGTDLHGTLSNPQPATIAIRPWDKDADGEGGITATYDVDPANHTGDGSIDSISLTGVVGGAYVDASVAHVPANLDICLQTDTGNLCRPTWTPTRATDRDVLPPDFAMHFFPTGLDGLVPSTPLVVNGIACTDTTDAAACHDLGSNRKRIVIDDLRFKTVEAAFSSHDEGCTVACGAVWAAASTHGPGSPAEGDHITGRVRYFDGDGDIFPDPKIDLKLNDPDDFIALNRLFFFLHYDVVSLSPLEWASTGSLTCGAHPNLVVGINNFPDPDLLDGTFGVC